jgi:hypothetical protein
MISSRFQKWLLAFLLEANVAIVQKVEPAK